MRYLSNIFLVGIMLIVFACDDDIEELITSNPETQTDPLSLLRGENNIGAIIGFNADNPQTTTDSIEDRWQEARSAGMRSGRIQIDWPDLEPNPNQFDQNALQSRLEDMQSQGLQTFLLISAYDSEGPVLPADLEGRSFDDPELINRFKNLMNWVIPMLAENDGYAISISNEADNIFADLPELPGQLLTFLNESKSHIKSIDDRIAVTITFAEGSLKSNFPGTDALIAACDVACFNFYGSEGTDSSPFNRTLTPAEIRSDIQQMLQIAGDKPILIQELGMHSGSEILASNEEIQRQFFEVFFTEMQKEERIRAAYVFQLVDWSPTLTSSYIQLLEGLPQEFIDGFEESLNTIGLLHYEDGQRKAAWGEFMRWVEEFAE